jgi:hypothetical protein
VQVGNTLWSLNFITMPGALQPALVAMLYFARASVHQCSWCSLLACALLFCSTASLDRACEIHQVVCVGCARPSGQQQYCLMP